MFSLNKGQEALAKADPEAMVPLMEGYRYQFLASSYGGSAQRWVLMHSERRRPQARRTVENCLRTQSTAVGKVFKKLHRTMFARAANAQQ